MSAAKIVRKSMQKNALKRKDQKHCKVEGCTKKNRSHGVCSRHGGGRRCMIDGCTKGADTTSPLNLCIAHGGGRECAIDGCTTSARGGIKFCLKHSH